MYRKEASSGMAFSQRGAPQTIAPIACNNPLPVLASFLPCASLRESLNRENPNPKRDLSAMSLVIQGF
jgi:hypothetical protein